jgi:hypothetical protein
MDELSEFRATVVESVGARADAPFRAVARYNQWLDALLFLREDCAYVAERVDPLLTIFWSPDGDRLVGFKFKGLRFVFLAIQRVFDAPDDHFPPLVKWLEYAFSSGLGDEVLRQQDEKREDRENKYRLVRAMAQEAKIPKEDRELIAAGS